MNPIKFLPVDFKPAEALSSSNLQKPKTILTSCQHENEYLLKNNSAADLVNCAHTTLKLSRCTGQLFGVKAPEYIKRGRSVVYRKSTLEKWLAQFVERPNTSA